MNYKRRARTSEAAIEAVRAAARKLRAERGLEPELAENAEYEAAQALRAAKKRKKAVKS